MHCPWCSKDVPTRNGRIYPHLTSGGIRCVAGGQTIQTAEFLNESPSTTARRKVAEKIGKKGMP